MDFITYKSLSKELERVDQILAIGAIDGKVCVISPRGMRLFNTSQKLDTETMTETMLGKDSLREEIRK